MPGHHNEPVAEDIMAGELVCVIVQRADPVERWQLTGASSLVSTRAEQGALSIRDFCVREVSCGAAVLTVPAARRALCVVLGFGDRY